MVIGRMEMTEMLEVPRCSICGEYVSGNVRMYINGVAYHSHCYGRIQNETSLASAIIRLAAVLEKLERKL